MSVGVAVEGEGLASLDGVVRAVVDGAVAVVVDPVAALDGVGVVIVAVVATHGCGQVAVAIGVETLVERGATDPGASGERDQREQGPSHGLHPTAVVARRRSGT